jgi:hypothetical protein
MEPSNSNIVTYEGSYKDNFTTFILHKSNIQNANWKSNHITTKTTNQPHFYAFDHLCIVFPTKHHDNTNRTVNRILKFFKGTSAGTAEAYTTLQLVRQIKNLIIYLIRYGLRRFTKFGTKINHLASYFDALDQWFQFFIMLKDISVNSGKVSTRVGFSEPPQVLHFYSFLDVHSKHSFFK